MKKNKVNSTNLGNLGMLRIGTKAIYLKQDKAGSNSVVVKLIKWSDLTNLINAKEINSITEYRIDMQKFYKRALVKIEKGDLIFSTLPSLSGENIILIDRNFEDTYICNDNMFIFKNINQIFVLNHVKTLNIFMKLTIIVVINIVLEYIKYKTII